MTITIASLTASARQDWLGWKQTLYGWITVAWHHFLLTTYFTKVRWYSWQWGTCATSTFILSMTTPLTIPNFMPLLNTSFTPISLDPTLLALLTHTTIDHIMQKTRRNLWKWIKISLACIQVHQEGAQQQAPLHTHDIQHYFQAWTHPPIPTDASKNLLWPLELPIGSTNSVGLTWLCYVNGTSDNTINSVTFLIFNPCFKLSMPNTTPWLEQRFIGSLLPLHPLKRLPLSSWSCQHLVPDTPCSVHLNQQNHWFSTFATYPCLHPHQRRGVLATQSFLTQTLDHEDLFLKNV